MSLQFNGNLDKEARLNILQERATRILDDADYQRTLTEEELEERQHKFVENSINLARLDNDLTDQKAKHSIASAPLIKENKILLRELEGQKESVTGTLYLVPDFEASIMEMFSAEGELIGSRPLQKDEMQGGLFQEPDTEDEEAAEVLAR